MPLDVLLIEYNAEGAARTRALLAAARRLRLMAQADDIDGALQRIAAERPDVVLLDLDHPEGRSLEPLRALVAAEPEIAVVAMSEEEDEALADHAVQEGAQDYLVKAEAQGPLLARALAYAVERKRTREALRERTQLMLSIFDQMNEGLIAVDHQQRVILANRAARSMASDRDWRDRTPITDVLSEWRYAVDEQAPPAALEATPLLRALDGEHIHDEAWFVHRGRRDSGRWLAVSGRPLWLRGRSAAFLMFRDVTHSRRLAKALERARAELEARVEARTAQLEEANKELEAFSYSVSHDLREPLRTLDGLSQILLEDHAEQLDEQGRFYVERLQRASEKLSERIDALLALSRLNRAPVQREEVDLGALARNVLDGLCAADPARRVVFETGPDLVERCDPALLQVVLENLLSNAWKFSRGRDEAHIEVGRDDDKGFFVRDDGVGFDPSFGERVFAMFSRYHTEREFEGTGIGLATVKRIVHRHGGQISVETEEGVGTTFYFTLGGAQGEGSGAGARSG